MVSEQRRILVVDDEAALQTFIRRRVEREGLAVIEAQTIEHGFALAVASVPDVMLVDVRLPDGNGVSLVHRLKEDARTSGIDVIVWSGSDAAEGEDDALQAGAAAYFEKTDVRGLIAKIDDLLRLRPDERA